VVANCADSHGGQFAPDVTRPPAVRARSLAIMISPLAYHTSAPAGEPMQPCRVASCRRPKEATLARLGRPLHMEAGGHGRAVQQTVRNRYFRLCGSGAGLHSGRLSMTLSRERRPRGWRRGADS
jgi:hypothetical protein